MKKDILEELKEAIKNNTTQYRVFGINDTIVEYKGKNYGMPLSNNYDLYTFDEKKNQYLYIYDDEDHQDTLFYIQLWFDESNYIDTYIDNDNLKKIYNILNEHNIKCSESNLGW